MSVMHELKWSWLGDQAIYVEVVTTDDERAFITNLNHLLRIHPFAGYVESVPVFSGLAVHFNPHVFPTHQNPAIFIIGHLDEILKDMQLNYKRNARKIEIPICYDDEFSLDLDELASQIGISKESWMEKHLQTEYTVGCIGFTPGFPYLEGLPKELHVPRRVSPRTHVAAGSVAVGGSYCGIYPAHTPGGWQLIGRTPIRLFDARNELPSLMQVGDEVRFVRIDRVRFVELLEEHDQPGGNHR